MLKSYQIKDNIYQMVYKVYIGDDPAEIVQRSGARVHDDNFAGFTAIVDDHIAFGFVEQDGYSANINTLVHEAFHAMYVNFVNKGITINTDHHEHVAYYLGWLVEQLWNTIIKHDNSRKKSNTQ